MKPQGWTADEFIALAEDELDEAVEANNAALDGGDVIPGEAAAERVARAQVFATLAVAQATIEAAAVADGRAS